MSHVQLTERATRYLALVAIERIGNDMIAEATKASPARIEGWGHRLIALVGELNDTDPQLPLVQVLHRDESPPWIV